MPKSVDYMQKWFDSIETKEGCWAWRGQKSDGYGVVRGRYKGRPTVQQAHRISFEFFRSNPGKYCVLHRCDNRECTNPDHLFLGTRKDNADDKVHKNRQCRGETANNKLTTLQVMEIIASTGSQRTIAEVYGVDQSAISRIKSAKRWKHLGGSGANL